MVDLAPLARESFCYLTTTGRRSGRPHEIEIWFGWDKGTTIYLLAGGRHRADWVANLKATPTVSVRFGRSTFTGTARIVDDEHEDERARRLLAAKYQSWEEGAALSGWAETALPIAIDLA